MPQNSLLPEHQPPSALRLDLFGPNPKHAREHTELWVYTGDTRADFKALTVVGLPGIQMDYLDTILEAAAFAWAYGEGRRDITKAVLAVKKLARMHEHDSTP